MHITVNGEARDLAHGATLAELLTELSLKPIRVAIEVNENLVPRRSFAQAELHDGDRVEIVTFVGGG
jgi:thiamine biosynthesis protein ThiS